MIRLYIPALDTDRLHQTIPYWRNRQGYFGHPADWQWFAELSERLVYELYIDPEPSNNRTT